jgi:hypothetical protein
MMTEPRTRNKEPFDGANFRDTGCHLHPACLECPEPICIFEQPLRSYRTTTPAERAARDAEIYAAKESGMGVTEIRARFSVNSEGLRDAIRRHTRRLEEAVALSHNKRAGRAVA